MRSTHKYYYYFLCQGTTNNLLYIYRPIYVHTKKVFAKINHYNGKMGPTYRIGDLSHLRKGYYKK